MRELCDALGMQVHMTNSEPGCGGGKIDSIGKRWKGIYLENLVKFLGVHGRDVPEICNAFNVLKSEIEEARKESRAEIRYSLPMTKERYKELLQGKLTYERVMDRDRKGAFKYHRHFAWIPGMGPYGLMRAESCLVCLFCRNGEDLLCPMNDLCGPWKMWQFQLDKKSEERVAKGVTMHIFHLKHSATLSL